MTDEEIRIPPDAQVIAPAGTYEEWVSHLDMHRFVPARDHDVMANQQGWWALPGFLSEQDVVDYGCKPEPLRPRKKS